MFQKNLQVFHPDDKGTYVLNCDASDYAVGGILYQKNEKGELRVIPHCNHMLKGAERKYFTSEEEILAVVYCVTKFRYYLVGKQFEILSGNQALSFLLKCNFKNARMSKWIIAMQEYDFIIR